MTKEEVIKLLRKKCVEAGTVTAFANQFDLNPNLIYEIFKTRRPPGPAVLKTLGLKKVISYEPETPIQQ